MAGGIKVALLTTATGLLIAIPVNIGYNFFVTRIDGLILDMEQGAQKILNLAWDMERKGSLQVMGKMELAKAAAGRAASSEPPPAEPTPETPGGDAADSNDE